MQTKRKKLADIEISDDEDIEELQALQVSGYFAFAIPSPKND
jgi:hypothetical protein